VADAVDNLEKQAVLTSLLADQTTDPKQKQALKALAQKFTDAKARLTADTHQALAHPNDKATQDKFHVP
jgi:endonuclease III